MLTLNSGFFAKTGAETRYDKDAQKVWVEGKNSTMEFTIGEKNALVHRKYDFSGNKQEYITNKLVIT